MLDSFLLKTGKKCYFFMKLSFIISSNTSWSIWLVRENGSLWKSLGCRLIIRGIMVFKLLIVVHVLYWSQLICNQCCGWTRLCDSYDCKIPFSNNRQETLKRYRTGKLYNTLGATQRGPR